MPTLLSGHDESFPLLDHLDQTREFDRTDATDHSNNTLGVNKMPDQNGSNASDHGDNMLNDDTLGVSKMLHQNSQDASPASIVADNGSVVKSDSHVNYSTLNVGGVGFKYFNKGECPVCHERGDCRQSFSSGLVHCRAGVPGAIGTDSLGFGLYAAAKSTAAAVTTKGGKKRKVVGAKKGSPLSASERDTEIRKLSQSLGLADDHREALRRRGLTDSQIEAGCYFSVMPWQQVDIDARFPGLDKGKMMVGGRGIAIPVPTSFGQFIGLQVRLDNPDDGGKYRWVSSSKQGYSAHYDDEMPIGVYRPEKAMSDRIGLVEGMLKPAIACQRWGHITIGAAGGNFSGSRKQLKDALDELYRGREDKTVLLYPDGGSKANDQVMNSYRKTCELVESWGYTVLMVWWGQDEKGSDADEIDVTSAVVEYLEPSAFFTPADDVTLARQLRGGQTIVNQTKLDIRYPKEGLFYVKSPMGTGKTYNLRREMQGMRDEKVLLLGYRNSLLYQTCEDLGLKHIADVNAGRHNRHWEINYCTPHLALCVDSLFHIDPYAWQGCTVILDEVESVIEHLLIGSTCKSSRGALVKAFEDIIKGAKRVLMADAGLTNVAVDYLEAIRGEKATGIVNEAKPEPRQVLWYGGTGLPEDPGGTYDDLIGKAVTEIGGGKRVVIATDSQAEAELLHRQLIDRGYKNGGRIDSTTKNEPQIREILDNPSGRLAALKWNYLIYSPAIGAGVSIEGDLFDTVYFAGKGVITSSAVMQMLGRVRASVPWHICVPDNSFLDSTNPHETAIEVMARWRWNAQADLMLQGAGSFREYMREFNIEKPDFDREAREELWQENIEGALKVFWGRVDGAKTLHHITAARIKVRDNYERRRLSHTLYERLESNGCIIHDTIRGSAVEPTETTRETLKQEAAQRIFDAPDIEIEEARRILQNDRSRQSEREAAIKAVLCDKLPGVGLNVELIRKCHVDDKGRWLRGVENQWLREHPEVLQERGIRKWMKQYRMDIIFHNDISTRRLKLKALEKLNIGVFLDPTREFTNKSPEVIAVKNALLRSSNLREILGVSVTPKSYGIKLVSDILDSTLGTGLSMRKSNGVETYFVGKDYHEDEFRLKILAAIELKNSAKPTEKYEWKAPTSNTSNPRTV